MAELTVLTGTLTNDPCLDGNDSSLLQIITKLNSYASPINTNTTGVAVNVKNIATNVKNINILDTKVSRNEFDIIAINERLLIIESTLGI